MPLPRSFFNPVIYSRIRDLWFDGLPPTATTPTESLVQRWYPRDKAVRDAFDSECKEHLQETLAAIGPSQGIPMESMKRDLEDEVLKCPDDKEKSQTALSLLILLDQVSRNLYRTPETLKLVYNHYDVLSLSLLHRLLQMNPRPDLHPDIRYRFVIRWWFYMPLMHSESQSDHKLLLSILDDCRADAEAKGDEDAVKFLDNSRKFEDIHADIIDKFGRFPHRNDCLDRQATEEEKHYLEKGGERFGVGGK